ncbi:MAG: tetratricopeptide repeat protein [Acidobacteria bacterium]|nr:tetratricopeptide repeat protein [Acidobacteriota bacterium]
MTPEEHYDRALEAFASGNLEEAVAEYQKALALNPSFTDALHGLAQAYAQQGNLDEAIATARRIAEIDPDDVLAHTSLSRFLQQQGKKAEAEEEANQARILGWKQQLKEQKAKSDG